MSKLYDFFSILVFKLYFCLIKCLNFSILVSQRYFYSIKCLKFSIFSILTSLTLFLFNQVFELLIFAQSSVS